MMKNIQCPNCGGTVDIAEDGVYATCQYCSSKLYFKDNEIHLLTEKVYKLDEQIKTDDSLTKNTRNSRLLAWLGIGISALLCVWANIYIAFGNYDANSNAFSEIGPIALPLICSPILLIVWEIILAKKYEGYNVFKNKRGNKVVSRATFVTKYIVFGLLIDLIVFTTLGVILLK